jgi:hypothetical protein
VRIATNAHQVLPDSWHNSLVEAVVRAELSEPDRLTPELLPIRRPGSWHLNLTFPGLRPESFKCRRKRGKSSRRVDRAQDCCVSIRPEGAVS